MNSMRSSRGGVQASPSSGGGNLGSLDLESLLTIKVITTSRFSGSKDQRGVALFAHAENLGNYQVWLPDWGDSIDSVPFNRGGTVCFGFEFLLGGERSR